MTYLDLASLPKDDIDSIHVDHHSSDVGDLLVASPALVLGVHGEVRQTGGAVAWLGQGVGTGSHVMMCFFVVGRIVGVAARRAHSFA